MSTKLLTDFDNILNVFHATCRSVYPVLFSSFVNYYIFSYIQYIMYNIYALNTFYWQSYVFLTIFFPRTT